MSASRRPSLFAASALHALWCASVILGCRGGAPSPVPIDTRNDTCAWCRMTISDTRFAAQLLAPSEEPHLFDDIGCLRDYLADPAVVQNPEAAAFVVDHRTRAWVPAARAVYRQAPAETTPMASGLAAWTDDASCTADPAASTWLRRSATDIFGPAGPPGGRP